MARILALSSHVAFGTVGLSVIVPALQALGHEVVALPTIVLSSHPGYGPFAGEEISPSNINQMIDALDANGWLQDVDAILTGYLPTEAHVESVHEAVRRLRAVKPDVLVVVDPVCGDEPEGLYLDAAVPAAIAALLLPVCDLATPNRFELSWMTQAPADSPKEAVAAARALGVPAVLATSVPWDGEGEEGNVLATLLVGADAALASIVPKRETAPHGTGDLLAALYLGHVLNGLSADVALGKAVGGVEASIAAAHGRDELSLNGPSARWADIQPLPALSV